MTSEKINERVQINVNFKLWRYVPSKGDYLKNFHSRNPWDSSSTDFPLPRFRFVCGVWDPSVSVAETGQTPNSAPGGIPMCLCYW